MRIVRDRGDRRHEDDQASLMAAARRCTSAPKASSRWRSKGARTAKGWLATLMVVTSVAAHAADDASWEAACAAASPLEKIVAHSPSGDMLEDDMTLTLVWRDGLRTPLPWPSALYRWSDGLAAGGSACRGLGVVPAGAGTLAVVVAADGRPGPDHLRIALVDTRTHALLDAIGDLGEVPNDHPHRYAGGRLAFSVYRRWSHDIGIPAWKDVTVIGGRLRARWRD